VNVGSAVSDLRLEDLQIISFAWIFDVKQGMQTV